MLSAIQLYISSPLGQTGFINASLPDSGRLSPTTFIPSLSMVSAISTFARNEPTTYTFLSVVSVSTNSISSACISSGSESN